MSAWLSVQTANDTNGEDPERRSLPQVDEVRFMVRTLEYALTEQYLCGTGTSEMQHW